MDPITIQTYDQKRNLQDKAFKSGCYAPFVSLHFTTRGDVIVCCKNQTYVLGNVGRERLNEIWQGGKIQALRQNLIDYQFKNGCQFCEWQISAGDSEGVFTRIFEEFPVTSMNPEWPAVIEFAGSNTCNFECVMCHEDLSSAIRANRKGLPPLPKVYSDQFFDDLRLFLPHLRKVNFLGGEPFLASECFRIWDMMIEDGLNIPCHVTTNCSQYNEKVEKVLEALPVSFSISLDGVTKETVESIRVNARYDELIANLYRFIDYTKRKGTYLGLTYCLMRQNWHEFGDYLIFAENLGLTVFVNTVIDPSHCSLYTLPPEDLTHIIVKMEAQEKVLRSQLCINLGVWERLIGQLQNHANQTQVESLAKVKEAALNHWMEGPEGSKHHVTVAKKLAEKGQYENALEEVLKVPASHHHFYYAKVLCGRMRRLLGDLEGADLDLEHAIKLSKRNALAFLARAFLRLDQNRLEEGLADAGTARAVLKEEDELQDEVDRVTYLLNKRLECCSEGREALSRPAELGSKNRSDYALKS